MIYTQINEGMGRNQLKSFISPVGQPFHQKEGKYQQEQTRFWGYSCMSSNGQGRRIL